MFGLFKKKTKAEILQKKYKKLVREWHELSSVNRAESDKKYAEAHEVIKEIESLSKN